MKRSYNILPCMIAAALMSPLALADEEVLIADDDPSVSSYEDEFDFLVEGERNAEKLADKQGEADEDFAMWEEDGEVEDFGEFQLRVPDPDPALPLPYSVVGKKPLGNNYGASLIFTDRDSVVAELPVLVARNPSDFKADFWVIGELHVNGTKVAETRQWVTSASLAQAGPTVAFLKMLAPVQSKQGEIEFKVFKSVDGEAKEALFSNAVPYHL